MSNHALITCFHCVPIARVVSIKKYGDLKMVSASNALVAKGNSL